MYDPPLWEIFSVYVTCLQGFMLILTLKSISISSHMKVHTCLISAHLNDQTSLIWFNWVRLPQGHLSNSKYVLSVHVQVLWLSWLGSCLPLSAIWLFQKHTAEVFKGYGFSGVRAATAYEMAISIILQKTRHLVNIVFKSSTTWVE